MVDKSDSGFDFSKFQVEPEIAKTGKITEVSYTWFRPKDVDPEQKPVAKVSYITKVGDQICGVGYYK